MAHRGAERQPPGSRLTLATAFEIETDEGAQWHLDDFAAVVSRPGIPAAETARIEADLRAAPGSKFDDDFAPGRRARLKPEKRSQRADAR
jgi:hypothetical protein